MAISDIRTKFHEKAVFIYAAKQVAEGVPAVKDVLSIKAKYTYTAATSTTAAYGTLAKLATDTSTDTFTAEVPVGVYIQITSGDKVIKLGRVSAVNAESIVISNPDHTTNIATASFLGTYLGPRNKIAALNLNFSIDLTSEAFQYSGDELDRDELTVITDKIGKFDFETFMPILQNKLTVDDLAYGDFFKSCGFSISKPTTALGDITAAKIVQVTNTATTTNTYLTIEIRRASPDLADFEKVYYLTDVRGTADFTSVVGTRPKMKWNMLGNFKWIADLPKLTDTPEDAAVYAAMKSTVASTVSSESISTAMLSNLSGISYKVDFTANLVSGTSTIAAQTIFTLGKTDTEAGIIYQVGSDSTAMLMSTIRSHLVAVSDLISENPNISVADVNGILGLSISSGLTASGYVSSIALATGYEILADGTNANGLWFKPIKGYEGSQNLSFSKKSTSDATIVFTENASSKVITFKFPTTTSSITSISLAGVSLTLGNILPGDISALYAEAFKLITTDATVMSVDTLMAALKKDGTVSSSILSNAGSSCVFTTIGTKTDIAKYTITRGTEKTASAIAYTGTGGAKATGKVPVSLIFTPVSVSNTATFTFTKVVKDTDFTPITFQVMSTFTPDYDTIRNICFDKLNLPNIAGFEFNRYKTGCLDGWSKGAVPTDVTMTILEDSAGAAFNPYRTIEDFYSLWFGFSSGASKIIINNDKMQLTNVSQSTVASFVGQDLTFRNVGKTNIYFVGY